MSEAIITSRSSLRQLPDYGQTGSTGSKGLITAFTLKPDRYSSSSSTPARHPVALALARALLARTSSSHIARVLLVVHYRVSFQSALAPNPSTAQGYVYKPGKIGPPGPGGLGLIPGAWGNTCILSRLQPSARKSFKYLDRCMVLN